MVTQIDCVPCFVRQALEAVRQVSQDQNVIEKAMRRVLREVSEFDLKQSPPEMGQLIHRIIREESQNDDPYYDIKRESDKCALTLYDEAARKVAQADDTFVAALRFAIAGNILDFALLSSWDEERIEGSFLKALNHRIDEQEAMRLKDEIERADTVLILGDNAGETVFDRLMIENFPVKANVYYAVKGSPVINDATQSDAEAAGIDRVAKIISNGTDAPGTLLSKCSKEFLEIYNSADVVIAKGQANFETLNEAERKVYFLTQIKCDVIAQRYGFEVGNWIVGDSFTMNEDKVEESA
jgi:hypothetical protein